jgi:deoxyribose-phosphate aldolase
MLAHVVAEKNIKIVMEQTNYIELAKYIEHTLLKPGVTKDDIRKLCKEAVEYQFHAVCVPPYYVRLAKEIIKDESVKVVTVSGFPFGYETKATKVEETKKAIEDGADEIDMVINIAAFKSDDFTYVKEDIESIATLCRLKNKTIKVIIETCLLSPDEIIKICDLVGEVGVDFIKTSTGFNGDGATVENVKLIRMHTPKKIKIKASGGIKTKAFAEKLIKAGADRIGTSSGIEIVSGSEHK